MTEAYASFELTDAERAVVGAVSGERDADAEAPDRPRCEEATESEVFAPP
jgi:tryptophanyl-tRNA synthetase